MPDVHATYAPGAREHAPAPHVVAQRPRSALRPPRPPALRPARAHLCALLRHVALAPVGRWPLRTVARNVRELDRPGRRGPLPRPVSAADESRCPSRATASGQALPAALPLRAALGLHHAARRLRAQRRVRHVQEGDARWQAHALQRRLRPRTTLVGTLREGVRRGRHRRVPQRTGGEPLNTPAEGCSSGASGWRKRRRQLPRRPPRQRQRAAGGTPAIRPPASAPRGHRPHAQALVLLAGLQGLSRQRRCGRRRLPRGVRRDERRGRTGLPAMRRRGRGGRP